MIIKSVLELIGQTPCIELTNIAGENAAQVYGKMELNNPGGSIKDRPCLKMIQEAEESGKLVADSTIIEPTTGNTGIGLAMICAVKKYRCILTMPEDLSLERIYLLRSYGAEVVLTPAKKGVSGAIEKAEELAKSIPNSFIPLQFKSTANPEAHRQTTAQEIIQDFPEGVDAFVAGVGTGGTITGCGEVLKSKFPQTKLIAVEPENCAVLSGKKPGPHRLQGIGAGFIPEILNQKIIDRILPINDQEAFEMTRRLGKEYGLCVGISAGANVLAAIKVAQQLKSNQKVLTILCDTGERYFSMEQFFEG